MNSSTTIERDSSPPVREERLQKILARWGVASRRRAEVLIEQGRVRINGRVVDRPGQKANPDRDRIEVDGNLLQPQQRPQPLYLLLHKPLGIISTCHDPQNRRTVLDLLPPELRGATGLHPVGRLDAQSTGALLLTNDGDLTFQLTHPRHGIPKTYHVWINGSPDNSVLHHWRTGVYYEGIKTLPARVRRIQTKRKHQTLLEIILHEGRNRQIRKVAETLGFPVIRLHRVAIGPIQVYPLSRGQYRFLRSYELERLKENCGRNNIGGEGA